MRSNNGLRHMTKAEIEIVAKALYAANKFKKDWDHPKINKAWHRIYRRQAKAALTALRATVR